MKTQFKTLLLVFITSVSCYGQRHRIIDKSFEVDKNTSVIINLDNIAVAIEESTDGKIHFDYVMQFDGYSKKKMKEFIDNVKIEVSNSSGLVSLNAKSESKVGFDRIELNAPNGISINDAYFKPKADSISIKTKDFLLREIRLNNRSRLKNPLKYVNERFKINKNGKLKNFTKGGLKMLVSEFVIKIPPYVNLEIKAENSSISLKNDMQNQLKLDFRDGKFKTKALLNPYNDVKIDDATFEAEATDGGAYEFKNIKNSKIGSIKNVKLTSEFSKIEIGEINNGSTITDFNSEYSFYNWSSDFDYFQIDAEYSKINLFYPKSKHSLETFGMNTVHYIPVAGQTVKTEIRPSRNNKKSKMLVKESKDLSANKIQINIVHGIIRLDDDKIPITN